MTPRCPLGPNSTVRHRLWRTVLYPSWAVVALAVLVSPWLGGAPSWVLWLPFVLSVVLLGLPHGAVDHLVALRLAGWRLRPLPLLAVLTAYLAVGLAYLALWVVAPAAAFVGFIALTWFHWGQGDLHALLAFGAGEHLRRRWQRAATIAVRGGLPMLVPLLAFPEVYAEVAALVVERLGGSGSRLAWAFAPPARVGLGALWGALLLAALLAGARHGRAGWRDAAETLLLLIFFATVHPVLAIGLYFCLWHSPRHIVRLLALDGRANRALAAGRHGRAWGRFALAAAPATLGALLFLAGLQLAVPAPATTLEEAVGLYLVLIACLTLPHVVVVCALDAAQGVWHRPGRRPARPRGQHPRPDPAYPLVPDP